MAALLGAALLGLGWFVLIALMTQAGFSGNDRYLVLGAALIDIAGGATFGWAAVGLARLARRQGRVALTPVAAAGGGLAAMALCYVFVPNWVGSNLINIPRTHRAIVYQARLRTDAAYALRQAGGRAKVLACGSVMTEGFSVPLVAWTLDAKMLRVEASPQTGAPVGAPPNVIFQTRATRHATLLPSLRNWPGTHYRLVARNETFTVYAHCGSGVSL